MVDAFQGITNIFNVVDKTGKGTGFQKIIQLLWALVFLGESGQYSFFLHASFKINVRAVI